MLSRVLEIIAKVQFNKIKKSDFVTPAENQITNCFQNIATKLKVAFRDSTQLFEWFNLSGRRVRPDHFWFNVNYFCKASVALTSILFEFLD